MTEGKIDVIIHDKIATITFFHPSGNSFPSNQLQKLSEVINRLAANSELSVIVLQSEGKTFCAGASFDELIAIEDFETGKKFFSGFANVLNAMRNCPKIIIGKVQGKAVGGGVGLIAACDYVFATTQAEIKLSEIAIGIGPFVIEPAVSRKIGKINTSLLTLEPQKWFSAQWAKDQNLYTQLTENLEEDTRLFAKNISQFNPEALAEIKKVFWEGTNHWESLLYERAAISGKLVLSDFTKNALSQFKK